MKTVPVSNLRDHAPTLLEQVRETGKPIVITKRGIWHVAIVPIGYIEQEHRTLPERLERTIHTVFSTLHELRQDAIASKDERAADAIEFAVDLIKHRLGQPRNVSGPVG